MYAIRATIYADTKCYPKRFLIDSGKYYTTLIPFQVFECSLHEILYDIPTTKSTNQHEHSKSYLLLMMTTSGGRISRTTKAGWREPPRLGAGAATYYNDSRIQL